MNFYRSDFKHKIYGLYTGKYGMLNQGSPCIMDNYCMQYQANNFSGADM